MNPNTPTLGLSQPTDDDQVSVEADVSNNFALVDAAFAADRTSVASNFVSDRERISSLESGIPAAEWQSSPITVQLLGGSPVSTIASLTGTMNWMRQGNVVYAYIGHSATYWNLTGVTATITDFRVLWDSAVTGFKRVSVNTGIAIRRFTPCGLVTNGSSMTTLGYCGYRMESYGGSSEVGIGFSTLSSTTLASIMNNNSTVQFSMFVTLPVTDA